MLSVFGYSARNPDWNNLDNWYFGDMPYKDGTPSFTGSPDDPNTFQIAFNGTMYGGGGSGSVAVSLAMSPITALTQQCWDDNTEMYWDFTKNTPMVATASDACLIFLK